MAFPTSVNDQITDAVTQSNVKVVAEAPAIAAASLYQTVSHSSGILMENAVAAQQAGTTLMQTVMTVAVKKLLTTGE